MTNSNKELLELGIKDESNDGRITLNLDVSWLNRLKGVTNHGTLEQMIMVALCVYEDIYTEIQNIQATKLTITNEVNGTCIVLPISAMEDGKIE